MKFIFILYCDVGVLCITFFRLFPVDITVCHRGYHGDLNETFFVGNVDEKSKTLVRVTHECLCQAIDLGRSHKLPIYCWLGRNCCDTKEIVWWCPEVLVDLFLVGLCVWDIPSVCKQVNLCQCTKQLIIPTASTKLRRGVHWFHLVRLSVCGQNRVRSVSSENTSRIHFIFTHLINQLQKVCHVLRFLKNLKF